MIDAKSKSAVSFQLESLSTESCSKKLQNPSRIHPPSAQLCQVLGKPIGGRGGGGNWALFGQYCLTKSVHYMGGGGRGIVYLLE